MSDDVIFEREGGVSTLRMNRPVKKNALTTGMYDALAGGLERANAESDTRCVLIAGVPGAFCAGNDLEDFAKVAMGGDLGGSVLRFLTALVRCEKPLVAAVDGVAVGVGTTLLLHCDHVVASQGSMFSTPFVDLGLTPEAGSSLIAPRLMGHQLAFELLVMGRRFSAEKAHSAGFVAEIVSSDEVEATARTAALEIAGKPPGALAIARSLLRGHGADVLERIQEESQHFRERLRSPEAAQAFMAFLSRKKG